MTLSRELANKRRINLAFSTNISVPLLGVVLNPHGSNGELMFKEDKFIRRVREHIAYIQGQRTVSYVSIFLK